MFRRMNLALSLIAIVSLYGCHGDLTERVVANSNNTVTVTYREVLDSALFRAVRALGGPDPFRITLARSAGWQVSQSVTDTGDDVISYAKTASMNDQQSLILPDGTRLSQGETSPRFSFSAALAYPFLLKLTDTARTTKTVTQGGPEMVPALLYPDQVLTRPGRDPNSSSALANAVSNAAAVDSLLSVHLEISVPGSVIKTNGATTTDGATRWDLRFDKPTPVEYIAGSYRLHIAAVTSSVDEGGPDADDPTTPPVPAGADWSAVYASGVNYGVSPFAAWQNVGSGGTYDFSRWGSASGAINETYRQGAKFAMGVYMAGTGIPEPVMDAAMQLVSR